MPIPHPPMKRGRLPGQTLTLDSQDRNGASTTVPRHFRRLRESPPPLLASKKKKKAASGKSKHLVVCGRGRGGARGNGFQVTLKRDPYGALRCRPARVPAADFGSAPPGGPKSKAHILRPQVRPGRGQVRRLRC